MRNDIKEEIEKARERTKALFREIEASPTYAETAAEFDVEYAIAKEMEKARRRANLTQEQVARRMGTRQSAVSRMARSNVTVASLARYFAACGSKLKVSSVAL